MFKTIKLIFRKKDKKLYSKNEYDYIFLDYSTKFERYERAKTERTRYIDLYDKLTEKLNRYLIISSGALFNVMLIFIDKIVPLNTAEGIYLFFTALALLAIVFCFTLICIKIDSHRAYTAVHIMHHCMEFYAEPKEQYDKDKKINEFTKNLSFLSLIFLIISVVLLFIFVISNIHTQKSNMLNHKKIERYNPLFHVSHDLHIILNKLD